MSKTILVIGDCHIPFEHRDYLNFCIRIQKAFKCSEVVHIGDLVDNHAISYHEHDPNGLSPEDEMELVDSRLQAWFRAFPRVLLCKGNHDCYSEDTDILTSSGWKRGVDLNENDVVATLNLNTNIIEYQKPYALIKKHYNGEMIHFDSFTMDILVTPSHRMVVSSKDTLITEPIYNIREAHELNKAYRYFPVSGMNGNGEFNVSDDELRLLGWVLTDGHIIGKGAYGISQSKEKNFSEIRRVVEATCGVFFEGVRNRDIKEICGRKLIATPLPQHEFRFRSPFLDSALCGNKKKIPSFAWRLCKRQFEVLMSAIIDGDGSDYSEFRSGCAKSKVIHGEKFFLDQLQSLCVQNGWHATMRIFREKDYRLNVVPDRIKVGHTFGKKFIDYNGIVWCASVDNGTLVVRRNGNVAIQGNCLVDRKGKTVGLPTRVFKPFRDIWGLPKGWKDDYEYIIDGVKYKHGTGYSGSYAHIQAAYDNRMSCVIGHLHSIAGVEYSASSHDIVFGMSVGCGIDVKSYTFSYGKDFKKKPILGCGVVSYTPRGVNAQFIPMDLN